VISHVSAYLANTGEPRILFTENSELFDVRLDGGDLRSLRSGCESDPFAIPATTWVACEDGGAIMLIDRHDPTVRRRLTGAEGIYPSWMSDGSRVALVKVGCVVALYDVALKDFSLSFHAQLTFPENMCAIAGIALAPDGSSLAEVDTDARKVEVLSLAQLPAPARPYLTVTPDMLHAVGSTDCRVTPAWKKQGTGWTLTFDEHETDKVIETDLMTQSSNTMLKIPVGFVDAVAWTPAGDQLVFALSKSESCLGCPTSYSPSRLYVYTPPT
jgi:hypothetical protein